MQAKLTILRGGRRETAAVQAGETILQALSKAGAVLDAPCGGRGTCGKCRVRASGALSPAGEKEKALLKGAPEGTRLACRAVIRGDAEVTLPDAAAAAREKPAALPEGCVFDPLVKQVRVSLAAPTLKDPADDGARLLAAMGEKDAELSLPALRQLGLAVQESREGLAVALRPGRVLSVSRGERGLFGMAADIGTTTVAVYFYDLCTGEALYTAAGLNRQRNAGADVISRIGVCREEPDGLERLQSAILGQLNDAVGEFCEKTGAVPEELKAAVLAGNTTMEHIAAGVHPGNIAGAPFVPAGLFGGFCSAGELGLKIHPEGCVFLCPCVSAYVGGDITAGLLAGGFDRLEGSHLFIDVGTNGEMALLTQGRIVCCSTAAGPAFEGAHIRCGTGGVPGAVSGVALSDGGLALSTVEGLPPTGLCGSGLIDSVAVMLKAGVLDETGRIEGGEAGPAAGRVIGLEGEPAFVLDQESGIVVTQKDVREVQLAKSAIASGIDCLLGEAGIGAEQVDSLLLAGGFGSRLNPESACAIGLLPPALLAKTRAVGNAAGAGASQILLSRESLGRLRKLGQMCRYLELSNSALFQERYIENMFF